MIVYVGIGILGLFLLLVQVLILGSIQRLETGIQALLTLQLNQDPSLLTLLEETGQLSTARPSPQEQEGQTTDKAGFLLLQHEIDQFVAQRRFVSEDD